MSAGAPVSEPVDLLLITHNRREYAERTVERLLADPAAFRVFWWDNSSIDGTADLCRSCDDPRIVERHLSRENLMQTIPSRWFLDRSRSDVIGKVDDDTLVPHGWTEIIAPALREHEELGMIGCWTFWMEDFEAYRAVAMEKVVQIGRHRILQDVSIGGTAFLMRRQHAESYFVNDPSGRIFPMRRKDMTLDGLISGWYFPLLWAEHMDDPRSIHCLMNRMGATGAHAALTARARSISSPSEYLNWIREDARRALTISVKRQLRDYRAQSSLWRRGWRKLCSLSRIRRTRSTS